MRTLNLLPSILLLIFSSILLNSIALGEDKGLSPRESMKQFFDKVGLGEFEAAKKYLEEPSGKTISGKEIEQIYNILDKSSQVDLARLSNRPEGFLNDGQPQDFDLLGKVRLGSSNIPLSLRKSQSDIGVIWKIEGQSVNKILGAEFKGQSTYIQKILPESLKVKILGGLEAWQLAALPMLILVMYILSWGIRFLLQKSASKSLSHWKEIVTEERLSRVLWPIQMFIFTFLSSLALPVIELSHRPRTFLSYGFQVINILASLWLIFLLVDLLFAYLRRYFERQDHQSLVVILPFCKKILVGFLFVVAGIIILQNFGYNVSAIIAGLGVGGIAVALAGQKTIENLFGGIVLLMDRPIKVGQFGRFGEFVGTVEEVGLRSTKIRTLDRTVITVPNAQFSERQIENFFERDKMLFRTMIGVTYDTTQHQVRYILAELEHLLFAYEKVAESPCRARFMGFGPSSLDFEIYCYILSSEHDEFLSIRQDLFLAIMDIIDRAGTSFAFPSQTIYLDRNSKLDSEKIDQVTSNVEQQIKSGEFKLPSEKKKDPEFVYEKNIPFPYHTKRD